MKSKDSQDTENSEPTLECLQAVTQADIDDAKAYAKRTKEALFSEITDRLPPRPKCPDCNQESLTGNVHKPDCVQMKITPPSFDIKKLVDRFLTWKLPDTVRPDACVLDMNHPFRHLMTGTTLLTADEARQMIEHILEPALECPPGKCMKCGYQGMDPTGICFECEAPLEPAKESGMREWWIVQAKFSDQEDMIFVTPNNTCEGMVRVIEYSAFEQMKRRLTNIEAGLAEEQGKFQSETLRTSELYQENQTLTRRNAELEADYAKLETQAWTFRNERDTLRTELTAYKELQRDMNQRWGDNIKLVEKLKAELAVRVQERDEWQEHAAEQKKERDALRAESVEAKFSDKLVRQFEKERDEAREGQNRAVETSIGFEKQVEFLSAEVERLKSDISILKNEKSSLMLSLAKFTGNA